MVATLELQLFKNPKKVKCLCTAYRTPVRSRHAPDGGPGCGGGCSETGVGCGGSDGREGGVWHWASMNFLAEESEGERDEWGLPGRKGYSWRDQLSPHGVCGD